jgi:hypothetical protein
LIGLIVNARARGVRRRYLRKEPFWTRQLPADRVCVTRDLEELEDAVARLRSLGVPALACLGGDGSLHRLIDAVLRQYAEDESPLLLALSGGTMNGLPRAVGSGGAPGRVLTAAADGLERGSVPIREKRVLRVADLRAGRVRHGLGFAAGLVYRVYESYYSRPEPGLLDAVRVSLLPVTDALTGGSLYEGLAFDLQAGGEAWLPEPPHTVVAGVLENPFLWFRPYGESLRDDGLFHLGATAMSPWQIAPRIWSIFRGRCRHPRLRVGQVREARARGGTGYVIDGDLYPSGGRLDVELGVGPRLRFLAPSTVNRGNR